MDTAKALAALIEDPETFLKTNILTISGGSAAIHSGVRTFWIERRGSGTGKPSGFIGRTRPVAAWRITLAAGNNRMLAAGDAVWFDAHYVSMRNEAAGEGVGITHYTLPGAGGPSMMITSQLSACTFGIGSAAGDGTRMVTHIEQSTAGRSESEALFAQRHFAQVGLMGGGVSHLLEKDRTGMGLAGDYDRFASVIGKRVAAAWTFYMQKKRGGAGAYNLYEDPVVYT